MRPSLLKPLPPGWAGPTSTATPAGGPGVPGGSDRGSGRGAGGNSASDRAVVSGQVSVLTACRRGGPSGPQPARSGDAP
ncbi:MAG: hypothetical protein P8Z68_06180 [Kineosporiaceae bacterium]